MKTEKEVLQSEIGRLEAEHKTFRDRVIDTSTQRRDLQKNLADEKKIKAATIKDMVDFEALNQDTTAKGFVDKILKAKADGGSTHQLENSIDKLIASEAHCRKRQSEISKEIVGLKKQIRKLSDGEALKKSLQAYE